MNARDDDRLGEVVFERLVCGEATADLHAQLSGKLGDAEADRLISEAQDRIERSRGDSVHAQDVRAIRKRRLIGHRFTLWKILATLFIGSSVLLACSAVGDPSQLQGSFGGVLVGGLILAWVEWRERRILGTGDDDPADPNAPLPLVRSWDDIRRHYEYYADEHAALRPMLALVEQIEASPRMIRLHGWTSMHDLCIVQTPVTYPYDGPRLIISPAKDGSVEFRYVDTMIEAKQWSRVEPGPAAFDRLQRFTDQLHWFARYEMRD